MPQFITSAVVFLPAFLVLVGTVLIVKGLLGKRVGNELCCPSCEFDLTPLIARSTPVTCPECSQVINDRFSAVRGTKRRRPLLLTAGLFLLLLFAPVVFAMASQNRSALWLQQRKPADLLVWEWTHGPELWKRSAATELLRRDMASINVDAQLTTIAADLWPKVQANHAMTRSERDLFDVAFARALIPQRAFAEHQLAPYGIDIQVPTALRANTTLPVIVFEGRPDDYRKPWNTGAYAGKLVRTEIRVDLQDAEGRSVQVIRLDMAAETRYSGQGSWQRELFDKPLLNLPVGNYRICGEVRAYFIAPWVNVVPAVSAVGLENEHELVAANVPTKNIAIDLPLEIVDDAKTLVTLELDEAANKRMLETLSGVKAQLDSDPWSRWSGVELSLDPDITIHGYGVYRVRIEQGDIAAEFPGPASAPRPAAEAWSIVQQKTWPTWPYRCTVWTERSVSPGPARLTLTPDVRAAERLVGPHATTRILGKTLAIDIEIRAARVP